MTDELSTKTCKICKLELPVTDFWRSKSSGYYYSYCKKCNVDYMRTTGSSAKYFKSERGKAIHLAHSKKYVENNPNKKKAHLIARSNKSKIKKTECENCGISDEKLHMHHPDYSSPSVVVTLCIPCHELEHHGATK